VYDKSLFLWVQEACGKQINSCLTRFFADEAFEKLYASGALVFIFDSFDEIPAIVKSHHNSAVVKTISSALAGFVKASGGCVAAVASRDYKSPQLLSIEHVTLTVRPFDDRNVRQYINASSQHSDDLLNCLYKQRPDLYALTRNPFLLSLLVNYYDSHLAAPDNEFELYEAFLETRFENLAFETGLDRRYVELAFERATELAALSVEGNGDAIDTASIGPELSLLTKSNILSVRDGRTRFAHRRLSEFFRVRELLSGAKRRPRLARGYMDQHYDLLVLYASVCPSRSASSLAAQSIRRIKKGFEDFKNGRNEGYERMLFSLRFFRDAFRTRPEIVIAWSDPLHTVIVDMWNTLDLMRQKHAVEHLSLVPPSVAAQLVSHSLDTDFGSLKRAALFEARYIPYLQPGLSTRLAHYLSKAPDHVFGNYLKLVRSSYLLEGGGRTDEALIYSQAVLRVSIVGALALAAFTGGPIVGTVVLNILILVSYWYAIGCSIAKSLPNSFTGLLAFSVLLAAFWSTVKFIVGLDSGFAGSTTSQFILFGVLIFCGAALAVTCYLAQMRMNASNAGLAANIRFLASQVASQRFAMREAFTTHWLVFFLIALMLLERFLAWAHVARKVAGDLILIFFVGVLLYQAAKFVKNELGSVIDSYKLRRIKKELIPTRAYIETSLYRLKTATGRLKFIRWLDSQSDILQGPLSSPDDNWKNGIRPKFVEYYINNHLAILDEQWRGLSRR